MKRCRVHARAAGRGRRLQAPPGCLRGGRSGLGQDHRAGGVLPAPGGSGRGPAAHPGHHLHREGRRQHAQETGGGVPGRRARSAPAWSAPGSRRCTASARGCCGRTRCSPASTRSFSVADERESWRLQQEAIDAAMDALFAERPAAVRALIRGLSSSEFEEAVLSAYDAMRGAGSAGGASWRRFGAPAGVTLADVAGTLERSAARAGDAVEPGAEGAARVGARRSGADRRRREPRGEALRGHRGVLVQPEQVQARQRRLRAAEAAQGRRSRTRGTR